eukprot:825641_1
MGTCLIKPPVVDEEAMDAFDKFELGPDGTLTVDQVRTRLRRSSIGDALAQQVLNVIDKDGDGEITKEEFSQAFGYLKLVQIYAALVLQEKEKNRELKDEEIEVDADVFKAAVASSWTDIVQTSECDEDLMDMFMSKLDVDHDGKISHEEMQNAYELAQSWRIFNGIDIDGNGTVDLRECIKYFRARKYPLTAIKLAFIDTDKDVSMGLDFDEFHGKFIGNLFERKRQLFDLYLNAPRATQNPTRLVMTRLAL